MWLIVTHDDDPAGPWLRHGLACRQVGEVEVVTAMELLQGATWRHRIGSSGAGFSVRLADGRVIDSTSVRGIVNRIQYVPPVAAAAMTPTDREYFLAEQHGFFLAWLASFPGPILNPPTPRGLSGAWRPPSEWACLAARVGLRHEPVTSSEAIRPYTWHGTALGPGAITVESEIVDTGLDDAVRHACLRLARLAESPVLGIDFRADGEGVPVFVGASPCPPLITAGDGVLDAFAYVLSRKEGG